MDARRVAPRGAAELSTEVRSRTALTAVLAYTRPGIARITTYLPRTLSQVFNNYNDNNLNFYTPLERPDLRLSCGVIRFDVGSKLEG